MTSKFEELGVSSWTCLMLSRAIALLKWFSLNTLAQKIQLLLPRQKQKDPVGLSEQNLQIISLPWLTPALFFIGETCCKVVTFVTWYIREVRIGKNKTLVTLSIWAMKNRMGYFRSLRCTVWEVFRFTKRISFTRSAATASSAVGAHSAFSSSCSW